MFNRAERIREYLRKEMLPSIFCSGCGNGNVLNYTLRAIDVNALTPIEALQQLKAWQDELHAEKKPAPR